jgi:hypothetical protein
MDPAILATLWLYATQSESVFARALGRLCAEYDGCPWLRGCGARVDYHTLAARGCR